MNNDENLPAVAPDEEPVSAEEPILENPPANAPETETDQEATPQAESSLPSAPQESEPDNRRKKILFAAGFLGWYLVNGLFFLWMNSRPYVAGGDSMAYFWGLCIFPLSLITPIILTIIHPTRLIGLGVLAAMAVNLIISLILGLFNNAICFIPFFIKS